MEWQEKLAAPGRQGSAMSNVAMGFSSSLVFGVPLGRMVAGAYGWKAIFWIIAVICLFALLVIKQSIPALEGDVSVPINKRFALLKNPRIAFMLSVTVFVFICFSIIDTYITPFLTAAMPMMKDKISIVLMILGVGSLIGSKAGGFLADRIGINRTIFSAIAIQIITLVLVSLLGIGWSMGTIILLMIWEIACWTFGPTQNFNLVSLAPEVSSIALSLNSTFVQIGFSLGAVIGGIVVGGWSVMSITWISAIAAVIAIFAFSFARSLSSTDDEASKEEQFMEEEYEM
ncbi:MFS transporter [Clostridium sp. DL-VIII]|uniref:MFS transporter n=1 Tax=Clostridium sp. DL-VIII TaxID=641107 RepID=UPI0024186909|nr:MFS transporter [Clostridium sp. DL-VIII]